MKKRLLALLLTLVMLISLFPAPAFAEGDVEETGVNPAEEAAMETEAEGETGEDPAGESAGSIPEPSGEELPVGADAPGGPIEPVGTIPDSSAEESCLKDGVLDDPSAELNAVPERPVADELQAVTDSGSCGDNLTWNLENGVLTISGSGAMWDWSSSSAVPWYGHRETIAEIVLPEGLTTVGRYAFYGCKYVTRVLIPEGVTNIGECTFQECSGLTDVTLPSGITSIGYAVFRECSGLTSVSIPDGVTEIGGFAFRDCYRLTSVMIPEGVISIGGYAFYNCNSLASVTMPTGLRTIGDTAFYNCSSLASVTIPPGVTSIGSEAFSSCSGLTSVTIPSNVSIGSDAFDECSNIRAVYIDDLNRWLRRNPSSVDDLPHGDLYLNGEVVTEITVPEEIFGLPSYMFYKMTSLRSVTLHSSIRTIGNYVFLGCTGLKTVFFSGDAPTFGSGVFYDVSATALYPIDNETWTADKRQSYGAYSSLTWLGYRDVPAAYTIHYDPNGGSSAPADQLKGHGVDVTLTSSRPTRVGWQFLGWSQNAQASEADFTPGAVYSVDADLTLYAVWQELNPGETVVAGGSCGANLIWVYYESGLLYISGSGAMQDWDWNSYAPSYAPWYDYRETIAEIVLPEGLTSIGGYAFYGCKYVAGVTIPERVTGIGEYAFSRCSGLTSVMIPEGVTDIGNNAFEQCNNLTSVIIPEGVTSIGEWAFYNCYSLTSVTIPSSVTSIGRYAFNSCYNIRAVYIDDLAWWLGLSDSTGEDLPHGDLYLNGEVVTEITVPEGSLTLRPSMFYNMTSLHSVTLPSGLRTIGNSAFSDCYSLTSVTIPSSVTGIGEYAFSFCSGLKTVFFLGDAPTFGSSVFASWNGQYVRATALYPVDNENWTADKRQSYGAESLTWAGYRDSATAYTIHYDANGGSSAPADQFKGHGVDVTLTSATPSREYYNFVGWSTDPNSNEVDYPVSAEYSTDEDITLYAIWTPKEWPVEFQPNGGDNAPESMLKTYGTPIVLPTEEPTREGFVFLGWGTKVWDHTPTYFPGDQFDESGNPDDEEAIQLYAVWQLKSYVVVYKANGGEDAPEPQIKYYGRTLTLSEEIPTREGYVFLGWSTNRKATEPEYLPGGSYTSNKSASLYAIWEPEKDRPMFRVGEGSASAGRQVDIPIRLEHNPGIYALTVSFSYDTSALELIAVTPNRDAFPGSWQTDSLKGATWMSNAGDIAADETIMTLSFLVKEETEEGDYAVNVSLGEIVNEALDDIRFGTGSGKVTVTSHLPGDVNGDGSVTTKDFVVLMKYLAGEEVAVDESALDINGDGNVTTKDFVILMRYVAGEDVVIY